MSDVIERINTKPPDKIETLDDLIASLALLGRLQMQETPPVIPVVGTASAKVIRAIIGVMGDIKEIRKNGFNKEGKYSFIYQSDVYAACQDSFVKNNLVLAQREISRAVISKIMHVHYQFDAYHGDGEVIYNITSHTGACRFEFKSGATDDKTANKCLVAGMKFALLGLFKIPADDHNTERVYEGEADAQHENEPPAQRREPAREPERRELAREPERRELARVAGNAVAEHDLTRPFQPPPDDRWDEAPANPSWGGDNVPYGTVGAVSPPPVDPEDVDFRTRVMALKRKLEAAQSEDDAHDIWKDEVELLRQLADSTYEFLRSGYHGRWGIWPPAV